MRRITQALAVLSIFLLFPAATLAQVVAHPGGTADPMSAVRQMRPEQAMPSPVLMALQEWERLQLTPEQVRKIRNVQVQLSSAFHSLISEQMRASLPPSVWWTEEAVDEAALRGSFRRIADHEASFILELLRARDEVYGVLNSEQRTQLKDLLRQEADNQFAIQEEDVAIRPCTSGSASGGFNVSPRAEVVYSVEFRSDSLHIGAVFVARAEDRLYGTPSLPPRPVLPDTTRFLSGGTVGRWYLQYDKRNHVAWVDTQRVTLGQDNVVLVDGVESLHQPPRVVGTLQVAGSVYTGGCRAGERWNRALRAHLEQVPEIRAFVGM